MTQSTEINTSVAMLISVFGEPTRANSEANSYEWHINTDDGATAVLRNISASASAARVQTWTLSCPSEAGIAYVSAKLDEGENYYDGALHPELFINRDA